MLYEATLLLVLFASFAISLTILSQTNYSFEQNAILHDLFIDEEMETANFKKTYDDVHTIDEWWEWANGPLIKTCIPNRLLIQPCR